MCNEREKGWVFFPVKKKPDPTLKEIEGRIRDTFKEPLKQWGMNEVNVMYGAENRVHVVEQVMDISDITWVLDITLKGPEEIGWLEFELTAGFKDPKSVQWVDKETFADRESINQRYGF